MRREFVGELGAFEDFFTGDAVLVQDGGNPISEGQSYTACVEDIGGLRC